MQTVEVFGRQLEPGRYSRGDDVLTVLLDGGAWLDRKKELRHRPVREDVDRIFEDGTAVRSAPMPIVEDMLRVFLDAGLAGPPIPTPLQDTLLIRESWCWSTKPTSCDAMYMLEDTATVPVDETSDRMAVSHCGHGINSWVISYELVYERLALFLQAPWGGIYMDSRETSAGVGEMFAHVHTMLEATRLVDAPAPWRFVWLRGRGGGAGRGGWINKELPKSEWGDQLDELQADEGQAYSNAERLLLAGPRDI